jgi:hypothetical protein
MTGRMRVGTALVVGLLGFAAQAAAQVRGMPLFTNPRYGTGIRVHADIGQPTESGTSVGDMTVAQGGLTFALGPIGIGANLGMNFNKVRHLAGGDSVDANTSVTASAIAQLRVLGGGSHALALSIFGGASSDVTTQEVGAASVGLKYPRYMNLPVGAALGLHLPLGIASLNLWGSGRMVFSKFMNCPSAAEDPTPGDLLNHMCDPSEKNFRWAVGADLPILKIFSLRAAYDSGKMGSGTMKQTVSFWGVGASIGIGGMR